MKKFNLIIFIVLLIILFSCKGTPKGKSTKDDEQVTENVTEQTDETVEKTEEYAGEKKIESEDLTSAAGEERAEIAEDKFDVEPFNAEIAEDKLNEEPLYTEILQAGSGEVAPENTTQSLSAEPAAAQPSDETPSVSQAAPEQGQPEQTQPPVQPQTSPEQSPPVQPPPEEQTDVSETDSPDGDSKSERESSPSWITNNPVPAARIESLTQMGTMPYDNEIIFSRIIYAAVGQIVEIPFRGRGWVYLEEIASRKGIAYNSQRNDSEGQSFIFTLEAAGTYVLKFYRRDFIRDYILYDHVQIIVEESQTAGWLNADRSRVVAQPRWPSAVEEAQISRGTRPSSEPVVTSGTANRQETPQQRAETPQRNTPQRPPVQETNTQERTPSQNTTAVSSLSVNTNGQTAQDAPVTNEEKSGSEAPPVETIEKLTPEAALQKARQTFDSGDIKSAIEILNQLIEDNPDGSDEIYWLLGQYYEANSSARNILLSLDYYRRLVNEYPQSNYFNDARRRIAYLERFYINIQ